MNWYLHAIKNYAVFKGRARRKEYWMFSLINILIIFALVLLGSGSNGDFIFSIMILYYIFIILPSIAITVRRLHDVGQSGWMVLLNLVPYVGGLVILVFTCLDSQPNENKYGPNPKKVEAEILPESNSSSFPAYCSNCGQKTTSGNYCAKCGKELRS